jgi:glycosyltransferase involved in cell wall biosynthesis
MDSGMSVKPGEMTGTGEVNATQTTAGGPADGGGSAPLVSVVIPAYNAAGYIAGTLDSVRAQTYPRYEIYLVNDGSPDTPALEQALEAYLSDIHYIRQENRGPSGARNTAIRQARGKYIAFLDSDDLWLPHHLARQVEILENNRQVGLVYANAVHIEGNTPVGIAFESTPQEQPVTLEALLRERSTVNTSSTVALRQALLDAGLFDEGMKRCEDYDLWLRMVRRGVGVTFTREVQMCHRLRNGLAQNTELMKRARIQVYQKTLSAGPWTKELAGIMQEKIEAIEGELRLEFSKRSLLAGDFKDARNAAREANSVAPNWKLRAALFGLRFFPHLLQKFYRSHVQRTERRKRAQGARSVKNLGFTRGAIGLDPRARRRPSA